MYKIPARDTVAGVAVLRCEISKSNLMDGFRGIRSLDAKVRICLENKPTEVKHIEERGWYPAF